jgi:membrane-associated phospholipid phosphatase
MESTLSPSTQLTAAEDVKSPVLAGLRRQFLAMDLFIVGFLLLVIGWTLLSMVAPGARLYPHEPRYAWAEIGNGSLAVKLIQILCAYLFAQRFGVYYHRNFFTTGRKAPLWLSVANLVYVFLPILLVPIVFNLLGAFIAGVSGVPGVHTHAAFDPAVVYDRAASWWDLWLKEADVAIAGVYPALWFRQFHTPALVGLMMLCYLAYYVSPLVAVLPQILKRDWRKVRHGAAVFAGALMTTYIGYILVPATGPRFEGGFSQWMAEPGSWFFTGFWQRTLDEAEVIRWDAFPSGHVAIATVALVIALKYHRKVGLVYAPFVFGLLFATVFLGYHYMTDVLFGLLFAAFAFVAIDPLARWWESIWPVTDAQKQKAA